MWAASAEQKSNEYYEKSNKDRDFLSLGEPIKVGHHSERGHRKMIDDAWNNMGKSVEFSDKAVEHERVARYWDKKAEVINPIHAGKYRLLRAQVRESQRISRRLEVRQISTGTHLFFDLCEEGG